MSFEINKLLNFLIDSEGSDMILTVGAPPTIRIDGEMKNASKTALTEEDTTMLMESITPQRNQKELKECGSTDFAVFFEDRATFRMSAFRQQNKIAMVMRLIPRAIMSIEKLGLPGSVFKQAMRPRGLFLVTGPTGSGKTTTLATIIDHINSTSSKHIITIEDPIEFRHEHKRSIVTQREVGIDVPEFSEALRRALRQDPDVILIGEMRDLETISIALTAAETGHLVLGTLHTNSAYDTITRIVDAFPTNQQELVRIQLSNTLNMVVCQTLCKKIGGGRVPAYELMKVNSGIRNQIRENKIQQIPSSIQISRSEGNILMDDHLVELYYKGLITPEDVLARANNVPEVTKRIYEQEGQ
ncbi:MAG: PilT/PilU family type 4a pilus ATPase [Planctomycetes bacterium]|nr:PilT/PilU family type 4a pilus ATPase [Planctomycetota bacterium]